VKEKLAIRLLQNDDDIDDYDGDNLLQGPCLDRPWEHTVAKFGRNLE
jgi:hypothetical protein